jgi:hypothetical protein
MFRSAYARVRGGMTFTVIRLAAALAGALVLCDVGCGAAVGTADESLEASDLSSRRVR